MEIEHIEVPMLKQWGGGAFTISAPMLLHMRKLVYSSTHHMIFHVHMLLRKH